MLFLSWVYGFHHRLVAHSLLQYLICSAFVVIVSFILSLVFLHSLSSLFWGSRSCEESVKLFIPLILHISVICIVRSIAFFAGLIVAPLPLLVPCLPTVCKNFYIILVPFPS